ncbi:hypothetical protein Trydic_g16107 [Trypoxylus dichotomus]
MTSRILQVALVQLRVGIDRTKNLENAAKLVKEAAKQGAKLIALPECFNSPYGTKFFSQYAEPIPSGPSCDMLSKVAKENQIYLVGGTIPELESSKYYNTCTVWNPEGKLIAKFRKMHLFDIDIPGGITFKESDILSAGNDLATFEINNVLVGIGVCYDLRFDELAKLYRLQGCELLIYPGAFNMTTGPIHWEILQRDPWGKVLEQAEHGEQIIYSNLDFAECDKVRAQIPIGKQRRTDIYNTIHEF